MLLWPEAEREGKVALAVKVRRTGREG